jgi:hypothetical protein
MNVRKMMVPLVLALALAPLAGHAASVTVATDEAGDWGHEAAGDNSLGPVGDAAGMDLVSAAIDAPGNGKVTFVIGLNSLPGGPVGGVPEVARYLWDFTAGEALFELDGKVTNYSRGACDPTAGTCPPPRDPSVAPFVLRGDCVTTGQVVTCKELTLVHAAIDTAAATISITLPVGSLGAGDGTCVDVLGTANAQFPGGAIVAIPSAFFSQNAMPSDKMETSEDPVSVC